MTRELFRLFKPVNRIILSKLHATLFPDVSVLQVSSNLLVNHNIRRITPLSPEFSDHIGYVAEEASIFAYNMMKRGSGRNNAYLQLESPEEYTNRVIELANHIADIILKNPDINYYLAQEAPIGDNYELFKEIIADRLSDKWVCHNSEYGVLTMVNTEKFACRDVSDELNLTANMDFKYQDARFRAFEITESGKDPFILINLHAPHDDQSDTLKLFIENVISELGTSERKIVICGDWNATPQEIDNSISAAYAKIKDSIDEYKFTCPVSVKTQYASSYSGHQKALKEGQETPDQISVDGVLTLNIKESLHFEFEHEEEEFKQNTTLGIGLAIISGIGLLFIDDEEDDDEEEEEEKTSSPKLK